MVEEKLAPEEVKAYAEAKVTRGLMAKYNSMCRQREGLEVALVEAGGDAKKTAELMKILEENLRKRKLYGKALADRDVPIDDPFVKVKVEEKK